MNKNCPHTRDIACQQVLREDSSVFSLQWMTLAACHAVSVTPSFLLDRYLAHVRRFTLSLVRPAQSGNGIELRFLNSRASLITFALPVYAESGGVSSAALRISGGFLVQPGECTRGELSFMTEPHGDSMKVVILLSDYCPLLLGSARPRRWQKLLYRLTQALIHKAVTVRFLVRLFRELEDPGGCVRVVRVKATAGEDI